jgi:hypothetical protein
MKSPNYKVEIDNSHIELTVYRIYKNGKYFAYWRTSPKYGIWFNYVNDNGKAKGRIYSIKEVDISPDENNIEKSIKRLFNLLLLQ